jgi:hypothetical protein
MKECSSPTQLSVIGQGYDHLTYFWLDNSGVSTYFLEYRELGSAIWTPVQVVGQTQVTIQFLTSGTFYEARVQKECSVNPQNLSRWTKEISVSTLTCPAPTQLSVIDQGYDHLTYFWQDSSGVSTYFLEYRELGSAIWTPVHVPGETQVTIQFLTSGTFYEARVRKECSVNPQNLSEWSSGVSVSTLTNVLEMNASARMKSNDTPEAADETEISLYPNPASSILNVVGGEPGDLIEMRNRQGQLVYQGRMKSQLNIEELPNGVYILQIWHKDSIQTFRFMKK